MATKRSPCSLLAGLAIGLALFALQASAAPERLLALQQQNAIAGRVVDAATLRPIPAAQVAVDETQQGTLTDANGRFRIEGLSGTEVLLRVVRLGYRPETQTVRVGQTDLVISLTEAALALDEVVVTGTPGGEQRRALGTSLATIDARGVVEREPVVDVGNLLQGRAAGVLVSGQMGVAGGGSRILIRGPGSFSLPSDPLIYVDGVRINSTPNTGAAFGQAGGAGAPMSISRLNDIPPSDIESIEIIRGPAAATLYGTEASAGVIQIITKRGIQGRTRIDARARHGANWFHNASGRLPTTFGRNPETGQIESLNLVDREAAAGNQLFRTGQIQGYGLNVSGGSGDLRFYSGLEWDRNEGVIPGNDHEAFTGRLNLNFTPVNTVEADAGLSFNVQNTGLYHAMYLGSIMYSSPALLPTPNRGYLVAPAQAYADIYNYDQGVNRYQAKATVTHRPWSWLNHRVTAGLDFTNQRFEILRPVTPEQYRIFFSETFNRGAKTVERTSTTFGTVDYSATASWRLSDALGANTSVGGQYYSTLQRFENITGNEFPASGVTTISGASRITGSESFLEQVSIGLFVQQQFSWRDRLYLTGAVRADDHSAFGSEFELVTYPKVMASWVVSEEPFWTIGAINTLRLRGAFGESGQSPATFAALRTYAPIAGAGDFPAGSPQAPGNPDLGPERGREIELGVDLALLDERVSLELTRYDQLTRDVIIQRAVAPSTGFTGQQFINAGELSNKGWEALLRATPYRAERVTWDFSANVSRNRNEVRSLGVDADFIPVGWLPNRHQVGFPLNAYFARRILSAELTPDGAVTNVMCDGGTGRDGLEPGGARVDCATAPSLFMGKPYHDWVGSIGTSLTLLRSLRLAATVDFQAGGQMFESTQFWNCTSLLNHEIVFHPERYPAERVAECRMGLPFIGTSRIQDNGFTKLRELSLNYTIPERWAARLGAAQASISIAGRNLATWTSFDGLDPEAQTPVNWMLAAHNELALPLPRTFMTTLNVTF